MLKTAKPGQDLKIDALNRTFIGDDNFHRCRLCETDEEFNQMKNYGPTSQTSILSSWKYYIDNIQQTTSPSYNNTTREITLNSSNKIVSFISNKEYPFIELWVKITNTDTNHNSEAAILVSEFTYNSKKYDICIVRSHNKLSLVFNHLHDSAQDPKCELVSVNTTDINWETGKTCHITFKKEYNRITVSCNDIGSQYLEQTYKLVYDYPNTYDKDNVGYSRKIYRVVLRYLLRNDSVTGFVSNNFYGTYNILDQKEMYDDDKIYHLRNYEVLMWDGQNLVARPDGFNCLMSRSFIFNPVNEHLYWFKYISHTYDMTPTGTGFGDAIDTKSMSGQVIKVHESGNPPASDLTASPMFTDDNFYNLKATDNEFELQEMMTKHGITIKEIFDQWERFSLWTTYKPIWSKLWPDYAIDWQGNSNDFWYNGPNEQQYVSAWSYSASDQTIYNNGNTYPITGFRSVKEYSEYWIEYTIKCNDALHQGTDYIGGVVSWMFDESGDPHSLVILRGNESTNFNHPGELNNKIGFGLVYDLYRPTQQILLDITNDIIDYNKIDNHFCNWQGAGQKCTFFVGKTTTRISAKTTNYAANGADPGEAWDYQFDWELPKTKPDDWSNEMWNNINKMMKSGPIGLCAQSYSTNFGIKKQYEVFDDSDIYALHINKVYTQSDQDTTPPEEVYIYKPGEIYAVGPNIDVRIMMNGTTEIYRGRIEEVQNPAVVNPDPQNPNSEDQEEIPNKLVFKVKAYKKNAGGDKVSVDTYVKLTVNDIEIPNSEGINGEVSYHIQYKTSGDSELEVWSYPENSTTIPQWTIKGSCTEILPKRSWIFNSEFKKLYFFEEDNYTRIDAE